MYPFQLLGISNIQIVLNAYTLIILVHIFESLSLLTISGMEKIEYNFFFLNGGNC